MRLSRVCKTCGASFVPGGKFQKMCDECFDKSGKKSRKKYHLTVSNRRNNNEK